MYSSQGKYTEAEALYRRCLAITEKAYGPNHPDVAACLSNLGSLYFAQGDFKQAEILCKQSLEITEKALGVNHPTFAAALENYAVLLRKINRESEALELESRAKAIRTTAASHDH